MSRVDIDGLRKQYGDRRAFEWFMRAEDERYWNMTERLVKKEKERTMATLKKGGIAIAILVLILHLAAEIHNRLLYVQN